MIIIDTVFNNPNLPSTKPFAEQIAESTGLRSWFQVDESKVTVVDGAISTIAKKAGSSAVTLGPQGTASKRPLYTPGVFSGQYPAAVFDGSNDNLIVSSSPYTADGIFSWCVIGKLASVTDQMVAGTFSGANTGTWMRVASGAYQFQHGNGVAVAAAGLMNGDEFIMIGSSNTTTVKGRVNGIDATPSATNNVIGGNILTLGAGNFGPDLPSNFSLAECLVWQADILQNAALVKVLESYASQVYGVTLAG